MIISSNNVVACAGGSATRLESRPEQSPDFGELLLRLRVVGLCGTDLYKLSAGNEQPGSVLGHEVVGDVLSLGKGVQHFAVGDRIVVPHHVSCGNCSFCKKGNEIVQSGDILKPVCDIHCLRIHKQMKGMFRIHRKCPFLLYPV